MNHDLTCGNPQKVLWRFCLPLFGSVIFQQLYNIADSLVAGKCIGENALAAVGNSYEITLIFLAVAFGLNIGCSVVVSSLFGAKEIGRMKTAVFTAMISAALVCALLMAIGIPCCRGLLSLIRTPKEILDDSARYLDIYLWGLPFVFFYNISNGIFSALGDSKTPFWFLACSSVTNIAVDYWFVTAFDMGVAGVAWATFLCQGVSCFLAVFVVFRRLHGMKTEQKVRLFSWELFGKMALIAIPSMLQQSFVSFGNIIIQSLINGFGPAVVAGYSAAIKLNNLVVTSFTTIGNGISNYTAQNLGAGKYRRVREGFGAGLRMVLCFAIPAALLYVFGGEMLLRLFMKAPTKEALDTGLMFLRIVAPFYFSVASKLTADGILRGAGKMGAFMTATFTDLLLRVVLAAVLSATALGATGIWCSWPVGWLIATGLSLFFYARYAKELKRREAA